MILDANSVMANEDGDIEMNCEELVAYVDLEKIGDLSGEAGIRYNQLPPISPKKCEAEISGHPVKELLAIHQATFCQDLRRYSNCKEQELAYYQSVWKSYENVERGAEHTRLPASEHPDDIH